MGFRRGLQRMTNRFDKPFSRFLRKCRATQELSALLCFLSLHQLFEAVFAASKDAASSFTLVNYYDGMRISGADYHRPIIFEH